MSKTKTKELDVDFIGGQMPLTKSEEEQISAFIKSRRILQVKKRQTRIKRIARKKVPA
jgi:hypothetical protein